MKVNRHPIRKRSFLLFEILISMALILLCFFPMIKPHAAMCRAERKYLEEIRLEQLSQIAFCQIKERLYETRSHTWQDLLGEASGTIALGHTTCYYTTQVLDKVNKTSLNKSGLLLQVTMEFPQAHFIRTIYLERA